MTQSKYFIKPEFVENPVTSFDRAEQASYWSAPNLSGAPYYQRPVYDAAIRLIRQHNCQRMIDIGCGSAHKLAYLHRQCPTLEITGVDQESAIQYCRRTYQFGTWLPANLDEPLPKELPGNADLLICADVIEHLGQPEILLASLRRLVHPQGLIILSTPDRDATRGVNANTVPNPYHVREWNVAEFAQLVQHYNYKILQHFHVLPVNIALNRLTWELIIRRYMKRKSVYTSQVVVMRPSA